jgi:hypothetical protein
VHDKKNTSKTQEERGKLKSFIRQLKNTNGFQSTRITTKAETTNGSRKRNRIRQKQAREQRELHRKHLAGEKMRAGKPIGQQLLDSKAKSRQQETKIASKKRSQLARGPKGPGARETKKSMK